MEALPLILYIICTAFSSQSLLSLRKQQAVACLAFSCDWLAHKLLKMCAVVTNRTAATSDGQIMDGGSSSKRLPGSECRTSNLTSDIFAPGHKLRQTARKLSRLADDSLLCLRLEVRNNYGSRVGLITSRKAYCCHITCRRAHAGASAVHIRIGETNGGWLLAISKLRNTIFPCGFSDVSYGRLHLFCSQGLYAGELPHAATPFH